MLLILMRATPVVTCAAAFFAASAAGAAPATYVVDGARSTVRVHVGKSGAFSFAGHRHEVDAPVAGTIAADPDNLSASSVDLVFEAGRLRVLPEGEPAGDAPKVEEIMRGPRVLDAAQFPSIRFRSKAVTGRAEAPGTVELSVVGELALHGIAKELTIPVRVTTEGGSLVAAARVVLRHDQFGMKPVSAAGGSVKVANEIAIDLRIVAERR